MTIHRALRLVILTALAVAPATTIGQTTPSWTQWGGPRRDFMSDSKGLASSWPASGPKKLWSRSLGEGTPRCSSRTGVSTRCTVRSRASRRCARRSRRRARRGERQDDLGVQVPRRHPTAFSSIRDSVRTVRRSSSAIGCSR